MLCRLRNVRKHESDNDKQKLHSYISAGIGPDIWVPTQMVVWSVVGAAQYFIKGRTSFLVTRALLGMLQGGFIPEIILYLRCV